jgi:hypothetical protein
VTTFTRLWLRLTVGPAVPFGQYLLMSGAGFLVVGFALLLLGHRGNVGLPFVALGILSLAIGLVVSFARRR